MFWHVPLFGNVESTRPYLLHEKMCRIRRLPNGNDQFGYESMSASHFRHSFSLNSWADVVQSDGCRSFCVSQHSGAFGDSKLCICGCARHWPTSIRMSIIYHSLYWFSTRNYVNCLTSRIHIQILNLAWLLHMDAVMNCEQKSWRQPRWQNNSPILVRI